MRRTKIVCTIGPASRTRDGLRSLIGAGMDVARLNFSHGTHGEHLEVIRWIRELSAEAGRHTAILQDLGGPKIRTGEIAAPRQVIDLHPGASFTLTTEKVPGEPERVSVSYDPLPREVAAGDRLLLADGEIELEVTDTTTRDVRCRVVVGGQLSSRKGVNVPTASLSVAALTEKDRADLTFGIENGVDLIALSFVRTASDVRHARKVAERLTADVPIIAKIEKQEALKNIDEIIAASDGVMVARGDLGVEVPLERVPLAQKLIIRKANQAGKPVITATQMLKSMVENPRPTRAEVTDVANAIFDGTDAVMLSEETAAGQYPSRAVAMMDRIARAAEGEEFYELMQARQLAASGGSVPDVISRSAVEIGEALGVKVIVCPTLSGSTARLVSRYRPRQPIVAFSPRERTLRRLSLSWGVIAYKGDEQTDTDHLMAVLEGEVKRLGLAIPGDRVVFIAGVPAGVAGKTNTVRVEEID